MATRPAPTAAVEDWKTVEPDDWQTVTPKSDTDYKSVLTEEGKHPLISKALGYIPAVAATAAGVAASESGPGAVAAAGLGGYLGKRIEQGARTKLGFDTPDQGTRTDAAIEGGKQAAYELGGRAIGAVGGRALAKLRGVEPEVVGQTISGVKLPETMGQAYGKTGGFGQTVEHYLSKTFLGGPLQGVKAAQMQGTREILSNLSRVDDAVPAELARNWDKATDLTRELGNALYNPLKEIEAPAVGPVAKKILDDEALRLPAKAKSALTSALGEQSPAVKQADVLANQVAKQLGYKNWRDKGFAAQMDRLLPKDIVESLRSLQGGNIGNAIAARSELRDLASSAPDRSLRRLYKDAWEQLNTAIDASLSPEQKAMKEQADRVWRRSYIQEGISKQFRKMENVAAPSAQPAVAVDSFVKMVNNLTGRGRAIKGEPDIDILFDNPADRKAMVDLADFLKTKYSTLGGQAGMSEAIARVGVALEGLRIPGQIAMGKAAAATHGGLALSSLAAISSVMANPGGAKLLATYFRSTGAASTALAARIAGEAIGQELEKPPAPKQEAPSVSVAAPAPRMHPTDEWQAG